MTSMIWILPRFAKMNGAILGFHRLTPCPKCTPELISSRASSLATKNLQKTTKFHIPGHVRTVKLRKITQTTQYVNKFCGKFFYPNMAIFLRQGSIYAFFLSFSGQKIIDVLQTNTHFNGCTTVNVNRMIGRRCRSTTVRQRGGRHRENCGLVASVGYGRSAQADDRSGWFAPGED